MSRLPYIVAVDFDGTIVTDKFPEVGELTTLGKQIRSMQNIWGGKVKWILWTCRNGDKLQDAVEFCKNNGLEFDAVNANLPEVVEMYGGDTRKVYANIYVDDKASLSLQGFTSSLRRYQIQDAILELAT